MFRNILVPLDAYPFAEKAIPLAVDVAKACGAQLHFIHVMDFLSVPPYARDVPAREWWSGKGQGLAQEYVEVLAERVRRESNLEVHTSVRSNSVVSALLNELRDQEIDLIVMGTHARSTVSRMWQGSVADPMMRSCLCPVLLKRFDDDEALPEGHAPLRHVMIPLDGSELAEIAIEPAAHLAKALGARMTLVHVLNIAGAIAPIFPVAYDLVPVPEFIPPEEWQSYSERYLEEKAEPLRKQGIGVTVKVLLKEAKTSSDLINYAEANDVDLIAMATHGRTGIRRMLLGSTTDSVLKHTTLPLLVIPPHPHHVDQSELAADHAAG